MERRLQGVRGVESDEDFGSLPLSVNDNADVLTVRPIAKIAASLYFLFADEIMIFSPSSSLYWILIWHLLK